MHGFWSRAPLLIQSENNEPWCRGAGAMRQAQGSPIDPAPVHPVGLHSRVRWWNPQDESPAQAQPGGIRQFQFGGYADLRGGTKPQTKPSETPATVDCVGLRVDCVGIALTGRGLLPAPFT
jgi:hypothetical protein